ncbi:MAG: hypothetical protein ACRC2H_04465 [Silanimonas sp.]
MATYKIPKKFSAHWASLDARLRERLAKHAKTKVVYLNHIALGHSRASPELTLRIAKAVRSEAFAKDLRPDLFG